MTTALATATAQALHTGCEEAKLQAPTLQVLLGECVTFRKTGCALAWWLVNAGSWKHLDGITWEWFQAMLKTSFAGARTPALAKGATYPMREGELCEFVETARTAQLSDATSDEFVTNWSYTAWVYLCLSSLNVLAGGPALLQPGRWTQVQLQAVRAVGNGVARRCSREESPSAVTLSEWQKDMQNRSVGYGGEEISVCHALTWDQVCVSLPPESHGGSIDALDWVGSRTKEFLLNPKLLLKPENEVILPRMPGRVHMDERDKLKIASELVKRKICDWVPLASVHQHQGVKVLNGLFGVSKPGTLQDGRPILRLIMNLTGSNATQLQLEGGCDTLPGITSWQSIVLDQGEEVVLFQSDMSAAFYLFKIPSVWKPHLAFNLVVPGCDLGLSTDSTPFALCCSVIPMGWLNSVGIMQEISEALVRQGGLNTGNQIFRGRPLPIWMNDVLAAASTEDRSWFHVYLDNFCASERLVPGQSSDKGLLCHQAAEDAWAAAGVISSEKKRVSAASRITELGAQIDSESRSLGMSLERIQKLVSGTLWMLSLKFINRKHLQIMAGRWMFALQFRRPSMCIFQSVWRLITGGERVTEKLRLEVRRELLQMVFISPLLLCNLGAEVEPHIVATDASERGAAVASSGQLTSEGMDFLLATRKLELGGVTTPQPFLIISLFNGVGGAFRCYDLLSCLPAGRIAVECDQGANRICSRRWPGTLFVTDVKEVDRAMVASWSRKFLNVQEVHVWAGFPCTDLSMAKYQRLNLAGPNSSLFWEVPRIVKLVQEEFGAYVQTKYALENVASMDQHAAETISQELGIVPYLLDPSGAVPMRRPRFAWVSEKLEATFSDLQVFPKKYWNEVVVEAEYPPTSSWIEPDHVWEGESQGAIFPTCMKSIPRLRPPPRPAGLQKCSQQCIERWTNDSYRYPPYQYDWKFLITTDTSWRLLSAEEKELLLGRTNHTGSDVRDVASKPCSARAGLPCRSDCPGVSELAGCDGVLQEPPGPAPSTLGRQPINLPRRGRTCGRCGNFSSAGLGRDFEGVKEQSWGHMEVSSRAHGWRNTDWARKWWNLMDSVGKI
eukprot:s3447_g2.t1